MHVSEKSLSASSIFASTNIAHSLRSPSHNIFRYAEVTYVCNSLDVIKVEDLNSSVHKNFLINIT